MDWHASGIATSVLGSLQRALAPRVRELGVHVCGGCGAMTRSAAALAAGGPCDGIVVGAAASCFMTHCSRRTAP